MSLFHEVTGPLYPVLDWPMNTGKDGGYNFFSGVFGGSAFLTAAYVMLRKHNCYEHRCWRIGKLKGDDGHIRCKRHHVALHPKYLSGPAPSDPAAEEGMGTTGSWVG